LNKTVNYTNHSDWPEIPAFSW